MRLLLDTHALIWLLAEPARLRAAALEAVVDPTNEVFFSVLNIAEIEIKVATGKLVRPASDASAGARAQGYAELALTAEHAAALSHLPLLHRDPFDRMLIAQALVEDLTVVTRDRAFADYDVPTLGC
jgi:PIN domain nuclease of toxin-antitoxin system